MPDAKQFFTDGIHYIIALIGEPGSGKTRAALSFPSSYVICCDPAGIEILHEPANEPFRSNLAWYEYFASETKADVSALFKQTTNPADRTSIYGCLAHAKELAKEGKIKTLILDGFSYFQDLMGAKITAQISGASDSDKWAYYRQLKNDLTWFTKSNLMTLAMPPYGLNIILTIHAQRESEDQQKKQATRDVDIAPRIEGGFRTALAGMPRAMIYLNDVPVSAPGPNNTIKREVKYYAYCSRVKVGNMGIIPAKNSYGLPPVLNITNKSFYESLMENCPQPVLSVPATGAKK